MVALLKSGRINNRLLCEIATNDKFEQLMTDTEIYIDGHATSTFRTLYESLEEQRQTIIQKYKQAEDDFYSKTILAAEVKEEDFFCHVTHKTWDAILHDIRKAHEHDIDSTPDYSLAKKMACLLYTSSRKIFTSSCTAVSASVLEAIWSCQKKFSH